MLRRTKGNGQKPSGSAKALLSAPTLLFCNIDRCFIGAALAWENRSFVVAGAPRQFSD
jgi:hypothetical protein